MQETKQPKSQVNEALIESMFKAGSHFGFSRSRRHPSVRPFLFGVKNRVEIFDLEKTQDLITKAGDFLAQIASLGGTVLFVGGKSESKEAIKSVAQSAGQPFVAGRWIGGTFTNFPEIRRRVEKFERLTLEREKGELTKYTKKERLLIDREIANLERFFGGIVSMKEMPKAIVVVDPKREHIAVAEADKVGIPVIALASSDCNIKSIQYPIVANDASLRSITLILSELGKAFSKGKLSKPKA